MRALSVSTLFVFLLSAVPTAAAADSASVASPTILSALAAAEDPDGAIEGALRIYEKEEWKGSVHLGGVLQRGNVDSVSVGVSADAARTWAVDKLTLGFRWRWGEQDDKKTASYTELKSRFNHHFTKTFFGYLRAAFERDDVADLELRATFGGGVGLSVWRESDDDFLDVFGGVAFQYEDYDGSSADSDPTGEVGFDFSKKLGDAKLTELFEASAPLGDFDRFVLKSLTVLSYPLGENWNLENSLQITYLGDPPSGTDDLDLVLMIGLSYTF